MSDDKLTEEEEMIADLESTLLPCPFCGCAHPDIGEGDGGYYIDCVCDATLGPRSSPEAVAHQWNQRLFNPGNN